MNDRTSKQRLDQRLRSKVGGFLLEPDTTDGGDTLAIALCSYFERHIARPIDDPESENGWSQWAEAKTNAALDALTTALMPQVETTEPKPVAWRWIVDSPFEPRIRWGFSESKVEGVNAEPLYLRPSPEEPEPPHTGIVHAGGPHTIHEGSRADCVICSPRKPAWDCACNKPDCAYCGPRLTEKASGERCTHHLAYPGGQSRCTRDAGHNGNCVF